MKKTFRSVFIFLMLCFHIGVLTGEERCATDSKYTYDQNGVRYQLVNSHPVDNKNWNWLFISEGPC